MTDPSADVRSLASAELRVVTADATGKPRIMGYAAVFNSLSEDLGGFREIIRPGAFAGALAGADVRALINHDPDRVLGRTLAGTLTLREDSRGLLYEIDPPDTSFARDILVSIERGDVSGSSFRFYLFQDVSRGQSWRSEAGGSIREITEFAAVDDVTIATYPAYQATTVSVRSLDSYRRSQQRQPDGWAIQADVDLKLAEAGL
jgi:uncharacterized protein